MQLDCQKFVEISYRLRNRTAYQPNGFFTMGCAHFVFPFLDVISRFIGFKMGVNAYGIALINHFVGAKGVLTRKAHRLS